MRPHSSCGVYPAADAAADSICTAVLVKHLVKQLVKPVSSIAAAVSTRSRCTGYGCVCTYTCSSSTQYRISAAVYIPRSIGTVYPCVCTYACSSARYSYLYAVSRGRGYIDGAFAELQLPTSYLYSVNPVYLRMAHIGTGAYRLLDADISHIQMLLHVSASWVSTAIYTCFTGTKVQILTQTALRRWKQRHSLTIDASTAIYSNMRMYTASHLYANAGLPARQLYAVSLSTCCHTYTYGSIRIRI